MGHVVLLGDSIFDNAAYVTGGPSVIEHLRRSLPTGWEATLAAVDGAVVSDVSGQLDRVPGDATHLIVSAGGNDALRARGTILSEPASSIVEALSRLESMRGGFLAEYRRMLDRVRALRKPVAVCSIYDAIPGLGPAERAGLCLFNDVILREAARAYLPVIDLRLICDEPGDYAAVSPIEPSDRGGGKIARQVAAIVTSLDFGRAGCRIVS
ncbi:SGNH/GDSL hydrolase family protein [Tautonia sociabilis]|uniref:SGNH/GDSL hydrolase family protein n=1 Tax=Tautonia sociabilis TaxID=2080755 RepID=A0A432MI53_9BACT|nr:SGNH/GDSL hydrolase family protein [Tautonia sociabilis]RUL86743.1 SGNH/GDSL hydrolase family protein [Tautonia sociabilis]